MILKLQIKFLNFEKIVILYINLQISNNILLYYNNEVYNIKICQRN